MTKPHDPTSPPGAEPGADGRTFLAFQRALFEAATGLSGDALSAGALAQAAGFEGAKQVYNSAWDHACAVLRTFEHRFGFVDGQGDQSSSEEDAAARLLLRLFDPKAWLKHGTASADADAEAPVAGTFEEARRFERQVAAIATAWIELHGRHLEQDALMLGAWTQAAQRFSQHLSCGEAQEPRGMRALVERWLDLANGELLAAKRSEAFLAGQRRVLKASTDLRLAQRALGDAMADMLGYPTRSEMDDVHRTLTDLRREVRELRRQLDDRSARRRVS